MTSRLPFNDEEITFSKPSPKKAAASFLLYFFILLLGSMIGVYVAPTSTLLGFIIPVTASALTIYLMRKPIAGNVSFRELLMLRKPTWRELMFGLVSGVGLMAVLIVTTTVLTLCGVHLSSSKTTVEITHTSGVVHLFMVFIFSPVIAPIAEELFFRGLIFSNMAEGWRKGSKRFWVPAFISSAMFGLLHLQGFTEAVDVFVVCWVFVAGFIYAYLAWRYKNVWVSVVSHCTYNAITMGFAAVVPPLLLK